MMVGYTGTRDFETVVLEGYLDQEIVLETTRGELKFRPVSKEGSVITGRTADNRLVSLDLDDPDSIIID